MNASHDLGRRIADHYAGEAPSRAPDWVLREALATIESIPQRRALSRVPWRFPPMIGSSRLAVAAAAVIAVGVVGLAFLNGRTPGPGGVASPGPSLPPSAAPTARPMPPSQAAPPPLTKTFTSVNHGLSISYPANWTTGPAGPGFADPSVDYLFDPEMGERLYIRLESEALDGQTGTAWATAEFDDAVQTCPTEPEPLTVDGAPALICGNHALTWVGNRGYSIDLNVFSFSPDDPPLGELYDRAWFEEVLATVQLPPGS